MEKILLWSLLLTLSGSQASRPWAERNTEFAVDLYQAICLSHENNILISPLGTTLALGMVQLGAKGKAQEQIRQTLKFQETSTGEEFSVLKSFFSATSEKKQEFTFNLANALYLQEGFTVKEQYLHGNKEFFQSAVKLVDFQNAKACAETISTWVESKTDGEEFGPLTRLVLVNAIYFKGDWKQKFRKEDTQLMNFTQKDGYFSESSMNYQVLELPYKGDEFSLIIILPAEDVNIEEMEKLITAHQILQWFSEMQEEEVEISLPSVFYQLLEPDYRKQNVILKTKSFATSILYDFDFSLITKWDADNTCLLGAYWEDVWCVHKLKEVTSTVTMGGKDDRFKVEQKLDFKEALYSLNITEVFSGGCDLSGITGIDIPAIMNLHRNQFIANHPFLFIMKNNPTESIVFMGRVLSAALVKANQEYLPASDSDVSESCMFLGI
ncbi:Serpin I2 [Camelus dromedarius]|uniref:Serpin I2 n=1 Tax=Camelus dromedarius TaxID=9838 RepID=A0A5N4EK15_CAMDR|nr:Serpin I2 [Camelus dromedarius]